MNITASSLRWHYYMFGTPVFGCLVFLFFPGFILWVGSCGSCLGFLALPNEADFGEKVEAGAWLVISGGLLLVLLTGTLAVGIRSWIQAGRTARLVRDGAPFRGVVTDHEVRIHKGRTGTTTLYSLCFTFTDDGGISHTGKTLFLGTGAVPGWPWAMGEPILVLQDRNDPTRFEADIFQARADDLAKLVN